MSRLDEIETFVDIVDSGSMSESSRRTGLALSAVSRRLKDLEVRMGVTLLIRSTRKLSLTDHGQDFYLRCKQILSDLEEAESSLKDTSGELSGRVRVAAPVTFSVLHLAPILVEFMALHPEVSLELDLSDRRVDIIDEGFDIAIRIGQLSDSALMAKRLTKIRHVPTASPDLLKRLGMPKTPEDMKRYPALRYRSSRQKTKWGFVRPDGSRGSVAVDGRFECNNGDVLMAAALNGLGISLEPTFITSSAIADGSLRPLFPDHTWSDNSAFAVYAGGRTLPRRVRALIDHLADRLSPEPNWDQAIHEIAGMAAAKD